jgi:hypothetical protein
MIVTRAFSMFITVEFALSVILHKPLKYSSTRISIYETDNMCLIEKTRSLILETLLLYMFVVSCYSDMV